ncbi:kinase-like domain-containing protein [Hyaloraphidium curvatum]|nr:kinase-like domain-containing protein [Hyaloraphidium curvatum]
MSDPLASPAASLSNLTLGAAAPSKQAADKAALFRLRLENHYRTSVGECIEREERAAELERRVRGAPASGQWAGVTDVPGTDARSPLASLAGLGTAPQGQPWMSEERRAKVVRDHTRKESDFLRLRRTRLGPDDFHTVKVIGRGAFGEVRLVQKRDSGKVFAMKTLRKNEMVKKDQLAHVRAERDLLADTQPSPWVVSLFFSFQTPTHLYLIMEYLPGGDLMNMLIKYDTFSEDVTRFYIGETVLALESVHERGFVHRDVKPDNLLIDAEGHLKLSDFGLSTGFHKTHDSGYYARLLEAAEPPPEEGMSVDSDAKPVDLAAGRKERYSTWRKNRRTVAFSTVGTPDYMAIETFSPQGYTAACDWWSVGAIMFECLVGYPPFCSETAHETYRKILSWREHLVIPDDVHVSREAEDLIRRLICEPQHRLNVAQIKAHPFFRPVRWDQLRATRAPFVPELKSITDTSYFDEIPDVPLHVGEAAGGPVGLQDGYYGAGSPTDGGGTVGLQKDLAFVGYTFKRFDYLTRKGGI